MTRILFVDDEPRVLDGLRRSLRGMRDEWEMAFVSSGPEALEAIERRPFDVVVSDMRMPGMDGAELLDHVKERTPKALRIILSGQSDPAAVLRSMGSTHRYLAKPCDAELLKTTLRRADALRSVLDNDALIGLVNGIDTLPTLPAIYREMVAALQAPDCSLEEVGAIVARDIGMSGKILHIVNSAYFGLRRPITRIERAVTHLGLETIQALVLTLGVFSEYDETALPDFSADELLHHSQVSAACARIVAAAERIEGLGADDAYLAAMLHDAGQLVLASAAPGPFGRALRESRRGGTRLVDAERACLGTTHCEVGAYLIGLWGLPDPVVETILFHAHPGDAPVREFGSLGVVHAAAALAHHLEGDPDPERDLDRDYLAAVGKADRWEVWLDAARRSVRTESVR